MWLKNEVCNAYTKGAASKCLVQSSVTLDFSLVDLGADDNRVKRLRSFIKNGRSTGSPTSMACQMFDLIMTTCGAPYLTRYWNGRAFISIYSREALRHIKPMLEEMQALQVMISSDLASGTAHNRYRDGYEYDLRGIIKPSDSANWATRTHWIQPPLRTVISPMFDVTEQHYRKALGEIIRRHIGEIPHIDVTGQAMLLLDDMCAGRRKIAVCYTQKPKEGVAKDNTTKDVKEIL